MPFSRKGPEGHEIDFDTVYPVLSQALEAAGVESIRADFEIEGGFIHKAMYERLLLSEYAIADLTFANANVAYEIGVRHGAGGRATLLICAQPQLDKLPFDFRPFRVLPYAVATGRPTAEGEAALIHDIARWVEMAKAGDLPPDNPLDQVTRSRPSDPVAHAKADAYLARLRDLGTVGAEVADALALPAVEAVRRLRGLETELLTVPEIDVARGALLGVFLAYREKSAYEQMVELFARLPRDLRDRAVTREQLALALNRLAEAAQKAGHPDARRYRQRALEALEPVLAGAPTSETWGILGRIHKGRWAADPAAPGADGCLDDAIQAYENGLRADPRDYFPGVNAVTLRLKRDSEDDRRALPRMVPVVRFAVDRAPESRDPLERYWLRATRLELATADRDWPAADAALKAVLALETEPWTRKTTADNLRIQRQAFVRDPEAVAKLDAYLEALAPR